MRKRNADSKQEVALVHALPLRLCASALEAARAEQG